MLIFDDYAVIFQNFELIIFQLNLRFNRELTDSQIKFKFANLVEVGRAESEGVRLVLVAPNFVRRVSVENLFKGLGLFEGILTCSTEEVGSFSLMIDYEGLCGSDSV
jgi:hypothetical protein